jgi:hypothetical protein
MESRDRRAWNYSEPVELKLPNHSHACPCREVDANCDGRGSSCWWRLRGLVQGFPSVGAETSQSPRGLLFDANRTARLLQSSRRRDQSLIAWAASPSSRPITAPESRILTTRRKRGWAGGDSKYTCQDDRHVQRSLWLYAFAHGGATQSPDVPDLMDNRISLQTRVDARLMSKTILGMAILKRSVAEGYFFEVESTETTQPSYRWLSVSLVS